MDSEYIHDKGLIAVAQGCNHLKNLKLQCVGVTDKAFAAVGDLCTSLERLALYSFQNFTDKLVILFLLSAFGFLMSTIQSF